MSSAAEPFVQFWQRALCVAFVCNYCTFGSFVQGDIGLNIFSIFSFGAERRCLLVKGQYGEHYFIFKPVVLETSFQEFSILSSDDHFV